jgi:hypothetical protein
MRRYWLPVLLLFLVACSSSEPEVVVVTATPEPVTIVPTATPTIEPTNTPSPSPEPTATPSPTATPTPLPDVQNIDFEGVLIQSGDLPSRLRAGALREDYTILYDTLDEIVDATDPVRIVSHQFFGKTSTTDEDQEGAVVVFLYNETSDAAAAYAQLTRTLFVNNPNHDAISIPPIGQQSQAGNEVFFNRLVVHQCRALVLITMDSILGDEEDLIDFAAAVTEHLSEVVCW